MPMEQKKRVQFSLVYDIPVRFTHVAFNREGVLCGFTNPPIRQLDTGEWADESNQDAPYGEMIMFDTPDGKGWDTSVREVAELKDTRSYGTAAVRKREAKERAVRHRKIK